MDINGTGGYTTASGDAGAQARDTGRLQPPRAMHAGAQVRIIYVNACLMTLGAVRDVRRARVGLGTSRRWCSVLQHYKLRARVILLLCSVTRHSPRQAMRLKLARSKKEGVLTM